MKSFVIFIVLLIIMGASHAQVLKIAYSGSPVTIIVSGSIYYQDISPATDDPLAGVVVHFISNQEDGSANEARILKGTTFYKTNPDTLIFYPNIGTDTLHIFALGTSRFGNNAPLGAYNVSVNGVNYTLDTSNVLYFLDISNVTSMSDDKILYSEDFTLNQNYPNPFNPTTTIEYNLTKPSYVQISIYDINGRLVKKLLGESKNSGVYSLTWDGTDNFGNKIASGSYFYELKTNDNINIKKMLLLK